MKKRNMARAAGLLLFIILAIYTFRASPLSQDISKETLQAYVMGFGAAAPMTYIALYIIGTSLLVPGTLMTATGAIAFGTWWGTLLTLIGATLGASAAFWIARFLGKDFVDSLLEERWRKLKKYDEWIEDHGFLAIFYLRLVFFPFNTLNFAAGLTKVKFRDYFLATLLGIIPGTFVFTLFIDEITSLASWEDLFHWKIILATMLFLFSLSIPLIVKKAKQNS